MLLEGSLRREIIQDDIVGNLRQCVGYRTDTDCQGMLLCFVSIRRRPSRHRARLIPLHPSGGYLTFTQAGADLFA
jgi:hypothetical protein